MNINAINPSHSTVITALISSIAALRRVSLFFGLFVLFFACAALAGVWSAGMHLSPALTTHEQIKQFKLAYWEQFRTAYFPIVVSGSFLIAAFIAFWRRWQIIVIAGMISVPLYFSEKSTVKRDLAQPGHPIPFPVAGPPIASAQSTADGTTPQQRAVKLFPALAITNSKLNQEFVRRYKQYQVQNRAYFNNPEWPTQLARECQLTPGIQTGGQVLGPELAPPRNGETQAYTWGTPLAPLEIKSSLGTNYLVKLVDTGSGKAVMSVFVLGGSTVKVNVPLGTFAVKYAAGDKWYGYRDLFGPRTSYGRANATFTFRRDGARLTGYTITLYRVLNGNLAIAPISPSEF